ncbi:helix-turn-helix domain-containing protein [Mycobacterium sp. GA-1999]|nr:helix-turn-helix domain-containing protein [Mycobacterium sp. GA-1999]KUH86591.1 hypothetical protein AU185_18395 [Mycobacterium sp. GA-0227b]
MSRATPPETSIAEILSATADHYGVTVDDLRGPQKDDRRLVQARQIAIFLSRKCTELSLASICKLFGRDQTTVEYAEKKVAKAITTDGDWSDDVEAVMQRIRPRQPQHGINPLAEPDNNQ